jgi:hypothetical protein
MPEVIRLEGRALKIFPVRGRKPACDHGFYDATSDPAGIAALFGNAPGAQIAVATGEVNDLDILDVDPRRGGDRFLEENRHRIPQTQIHRTPNGGYHLLFKHAANLRCSYDRIAPGIEVKAIGGMVVWWPAQGYPVLEALVAEWPAWLLELAQPRAAVEAQAPARGRGAPFVSQYTQPLADYEIPKPLYFKLCKLMKGADLHNQRRVRGVLRPLVRMREGEGRNRALFNKAVCFREEFVRTGIITNAVAEELLLEASRLNGYVSKDGVEETIKTIHSGLGTNAAPLPLVED